jgi:serine/threonine-protein kinase ULK/ATG1
MDTAATDSVHAAYDVGPVLGKGGFAVVHSATHRATGIRVALKVIATARLNAEELSRVRREVEVHEALSREGHPNVVRLLGKHADPDRIYLVLEYCANGDLYKLLRRQGPLPEDHARHLVWQLLQGLSFLHERNVVHRCGCAPREEWRCHLLVRP